MHYPGALASAVWCECDDGSFNERRAASLAGRGVVENRHVGP